jgi:hypothetical protein
MHRLGVYLFCFSVLAHSHSMWIISHMRPHPLTGVHGYVCEESPGVFKGSVLRPNGKQVCRLTMVKYANVNGGCTYYEACGWYRIRCESDS